MFNKFLCLVLLFGLVGCASKLDVKSENPARVTFRFKNYEDVSVLTFWRKIEANGEKSSRFSVGVPTATLLANGSFPSYSQDIVTLDPGTYYLDSYQSPIGSQKFCLSEGIHYMLREGWNDEAKKPYYMSFTVKEGEKLVLPEVVFDKECKATIGDSKDIVLGERLIIKK